MRAGAGFIGREPELDALRGQLEAVRAGAPRVVLVDGEAGVGKTSLVDRFLAGIDGARILRASGDESEAQVELGVLDQLRRQAGDARLPEGGDHVSAGAWLLETLGELQDTGPVIVLVDDAHWADPASLRALLFTLRRLAADAVLTILVARADGVEQLPEGLRKLAGGLSGLRLPLGALTAGELGALAETLDVPLSGRGARRLHEHTGGNPLHARALLEELPAEAWADDERSLPAPRSFAALVTGRAAACSAPAQRLVEATAVLGGRAELGTAGRLAEVDDVLAALGEACAAGLLTFDDRVAAFPHPLVRAAVFHGLAPARRMRLHAVAATLLDDEAASLRQRIAAAQGACPRLADDLEAFAAREAAQGAWTSVSTSLAAASRLSATRGEQERRLLDAVDAALYAGDGVRARTLGEEVHGFATGAQRDCVLAYLAIGAEDAGRAAPLLESAWRQCDPVAEPRLAATIAERSAFLAAIELRHHDAIAWARRARSLVNGDEPGEALTAWTLAVGLDGVGRHAEAHAVIDRALDRLGSLGSETGLPPRGIKGLLALAGDDVAGARSHLQAAAAGALRLGSLINAAMALAMLARAEFAAGNWDEALVHADRAVSVATESDHPGTQAYARWAALLVPAARGDQVECDLHAGAVAVLSLEFAAHVAAACLAAAQPAAAAADAGAVLRALEPLTRLRAPAGIDPGHLPWQDLYADALVGTGRLEEAGTFLRASETLAAGRDRRSMTAKLARVRGRLAAAQGEPDAADAAFAASRESLAALDLPYEQALVDLAHGQVLRRDGRRRAAAERLGAASERLEALGALPALHRCDRELEACGLRPTKRGPTADRALLTPREATVVRLVATGLNNRQVAAELFVSVKTVERHLTHVYAKLGVASRAELVNATLSPTPTRSDRE